jgi:hypothetical protein
MQGGGHGLDMDSFPIVPLHQVPLLDDSTLSKCVIEICEMMSELEEGEAGLADYITKQYKAMINERATRHAKEQVGCGIRLLSIGALLVILI